MQSDKLYISHLVAIQPYVDAFHQVFHCKRCGECCNAFDGLILQHREVIMLKGAFTGITLKQQKGGHYILPQPCRFWAEENGCQIYTHRPYTCRAFPLYVATCREGKYIAVYRQCETAVETLKALETQILTQELELMEV